MISTKECTVYSVLEIWASVRASGPLTQSKIRIRRQLGGAYADEVLEHVDVM